MADKTEQPTAKRLREARKKGQVFKSNDLTQAFLFLTAAGVLSAGGGVYVENLRKLMLDSFRPEILAGTMTREGLLIQMGSAWLRFLTLAAPLLIALMVMAAAITFLQVKSLFAPEVIKPKLDKLNPLKGFKNLFFTARTYIELVKNLVKFGVIGALVYMSIKSALPDVIQASRVSVVEAGQLAGQMMFTLLFRVAIAFMVIGAADFMLQKKQHMKGLMMSKDEVKREFKEDEGDPEVKHKRKHFFEELMHDDMMHNVKKADVVVVNPTHLAVAVKYDEKQMNAPRVTAKGQMLIAEQIRELAKKHRIPVMRNVDLAHSLWEIEVGRDVPEDLYETVAEVLNWVYQLRAEQENR